MSVIEERYFKFLQQALCSQADAMYEIMEKYQKLSTVVRGTIGELLLKQVIEPYIPVPYEIGYGEIVAATKETSGECDLIVFKKPVLLRVGHVTVVPRSNAKAIIQIQTHIGAYHDIEKMKTKCKKQRKFADKILFAVYGWWLREDALASIKKEIASIGGKLFIFSQGFEKLYPDELFNLVREIQSACEA